MTVILQCSLAIDIVAWPMNREKGRSQRNRGCLRRHRRGDSPGSSALHFGHGPFISGRSVRIFQTSRVLVCCSGRVPTVGFATSSLSCSFGLFDLSGLSRLFGLSRLSWLNQTNQIDQMNQRDQINQMDQTDRVRIGSGDTSVRLVAGGRLRARG